MTPITGGTLIGSQARRRLSGALAVVLLLAACAADEPDRSPGTGTQPGGVDQEPETDGEEDDDRQRAERGADEPAGEVDAPEAVHDERGEERGPPPPPPVAEPVTLSDHEVLPNAKQLASDVVQLLTTYDPEHTPEDVAARALQDVAGHEVDLHELVTSVAPLYHDRAWSRGEIVYPQLGGASATDTSVMVVVRQQVGLPDGSVVEQTRTIDVRLTLVDGSWTFAGIADAGGTRVPRPNDLPPEAVAVLDDERIELPDSAVWDIHAGRTDPELLELMGRIADRHRYGVVVLETGHPIRIFDTDIISTHLYGLAVDIYHLDGQLVVDGREEGSAIHELVTWLHERPEVTNIGSPWALDGYGGRSFTDRVHQDHLHVQVGTRPSGAPPHRTDLADEPSDDDG